MNYNNLKEELEYLTPKELKKLGLFKNTKEKKYKNGKKYFGFNIDLVDYENLKHFLDNKNISMSDFLNDRIKSFISKQYWNNQKQRETKHLTKQEEEELNNKYKYNFDLNFEEI